MTAPLERREIDRNTPHPNWQIIIIAFAVTIVACIILA